jgi:hypothetical protein
MSSKPFKESTENQVKFVPFINYESIVCTIFPGQSQKINASCQGVHFTSTNEVYLHVNEGTHTQMLLQPGVQFSINFSEKFEDYVYAGLKQYKIDEQQNEIPLESYRVIEPIPILKSSWCAVICETIKIPEEFIRKPPCRRRQSPNIRAKILDIKTYHYPSIFNNRSANLALETLILAARIPDLNSISNEYAQKIKSYVSIKKKLNEWRDMDRFSTGFEMMDNYLINRNVKAREIFDL